MFSYALLFIVIVLIQEFLFIFIDEKVLIWVKWLIVDIGIVFVMMLIISIICLIRTAYILIYVNVWMFINLSLCVHS